MKRVPGVAFDSVVRLYFVVGARIGIISLVLLGCNADAQDSSKIEDQLSRIEARLDRIDERLQPQARSGVVADAVAIELPKPDSSPTLSRITVSISPTQLFVNDEAVASVALLAELEALAATSPDASVVIKADTSVGHGRVVDAMDTIRKAGFSRIAFATRSDD